MTKRNTTKEQTTQYQKKYDKRTNNTIPKEIRQKNKQRSTKHYREN